MSANKFKGWKVITYKDVEEAEAEVNSEVNRGAHRVEKKNHKEHPLIWGDLSSKPYWVRNLFPVLLEAAYLICCFRLPVNYLIFANFFFYLVLFLFYLITKNLTFRKFWMNVSSGVQFWKSVLIATVLFAASFGITALLEHFISALNPGFYPLIVSNGLTFVLFIITSLFLAPVVEETFYRGNLISVESKKLMIITTIVSILLYSIGHSSTWWGIISSVIWALPLTFAFIKTRNVYVVMLAHFIVNLVINIPIIISFIR